MDYEERYESISVILKEKEFPKESERNLDEFLYIASEYGILDNLNVDRELAIKIWNLVEHSKENHLPENMKL